MVQTDLDEFDDLEDDTKAEILPPHEITVRSHVATFLKVEGVGKGLGDRRSRRSTGPILSAGTEFGD